MCSGCKNCAKCNSNNADGAPTIDPLIVGKWIQDHLLPNADVNEIKEAYPKVMVYLESKGLDIAESSIIDHKENLQKAINDPLFLENLTNDSKKINIKTVLALIIIGILIIVFINKF